MFEEGGESPDHPFFVEPFGNLAESLERDACLRRPGCPRFSDDLLWRQLALQGEQHAPFFLIQVGDARGHHLRGLVGLGAGLDGLSSHVADAQSKDAARGHQGVFLGAHQALQHIGMIR